MSKNKSRKKFKVKEIDTAKALGSGSLDVLATPRLIAWMENVAMLLCQKETEAGQTSVGIEIQMNHLKASPVGADIEIQAEMTERERSICHFTIEAYMGDVLVAKGNHKRAIVDEEAFMAKL